jgi:hypothetical protein
LVRKDADCGGSDAYQHFPMFFFFASLAESIVQMTIADVFFVHQRGRMNTLYVWVWLLASYLGPLIAGFVRRAKAGDGFGGGMS